MVSWFGTKNLDFFLAATLYLNFFLIYERS